MITAQAMRWMLLCFLVVATTQLFSQQSNAANRDSAFIKLEAKLWQLYKVKDSVSLAQYIPRDFYDIRLDGSTELRDEWFDEMQQTDILDFKLTNFHVVMLTRNSHIVCYTAESHGLQNGHTGFNKVWVTSAWAKRKGKWMNVFYRENKISEKNK